VGVNATGLFWRWHFIVRVRGDSSIMEIQRGGSDFINRNMIVVTFPRDLPNRRPHVSGTGSWIDISKSCAVLLGNVGSNSFC